MSEEMLGGSTYPAGWNPGKMDAKIFFRDLACLYYFRRFTDSR
jgi:hypothetical protein